MVVVAPTLLSPRCCSNIRKLNKEIEDEYLRLAMQRHRAEVKARPESWLSRCLGLRYVAGRQQNRLHASTAFVEFTTLSAKQHAIQCNITGKYRFFKVQGVPDIRDIKWENAHVTRSFIETRQRTLNIGLAGGLIAWSFIVASIRSIDNMSEWFNLQDNALLAPILDVYVPGT